MNPDKFPSVEDLFGPKPARPPHPAIAAAEAKLTDTGRLAMEIAEREAARLLVNTCFFDPPIKDKEIQDYAKHFDLSFSDAELEIRRLRS